MSAALKTADLSSEARDFVSRGTPKPVFVNPEALQPAIEVAPVRPAEVSSEVGVSRPRPASKASPIASGSVVGLSFRLPVEIHNALMRASFERKMEKQEPWTQQEIVAEALTAWLKKQGYL